ncbi:MAG TPA: undecaprenyldiphospho-muramoylpentapeptide beta-N-acetylglucosaminyltransferase [Candidatus Avipropionibacterium avicola]|uniref:UDP-N-acetylglucosamine--N-acetylmuramyl-(pentapeptide) pyrophosphoryl-undecaprenol N-acetylglucosamine transferase n=1 Tax=Candidatus Avipropionibacterium avicola TaxID=2840701 RepID=A0A9D1KMW5_9ACTN|nr:undecaprenyldiphospho-muramoylpentapeptide beta-N-acetylglucosaminyltransferase [Candidatus Avipropionibacterium avicola]
MGSVVLAGGGSAGHTSPLIATAKALLAADPSLDVVAVGTARGLETRVIPAAGLPLELIDPVPLPRRPGADLAKVPFRLRTAVRQAREILERHDADAVVGFGGYVSMPVYLAARARRIPIVVHEQNALPGVANKVAARFSRHVMVSFPDTPLPGARLVGLPIRREIAELDRAARRDSAAVGFDLDPQRPILLVSGGSQGARSINSAVVGARDALLAAGISILHVLGLRNITESDVAIDDPTTGAQYRPVGFVDEMADAYAAADLMLCRSGAGTVVETAVTALPAIFVPLPHGNGEQARNADPLMAADAGVLVPDAECDAARVSAEVRALMTDPQALVAMGERARAVVPGDADQRMAQVVLEVIG